MNQTHHWNGWILGNSIPLETKLFDCKQNKYTSSDRSSVNGKCLVQTALITLHRWGWVKKRSALALKRGPRRGKLSTRFSFVWWYSPPCPKDAWVRKKCGLKGGCLSDKGIPWTGGGGKKQHWGTYISRKYLRERQIKRASRRLVDNSSLSNTWLGPPLSYKEPRNKHWMWFCALVKKIYGSNGQIKWWDAFMKRQLDK